MLISHILCIPKGTESYPRVPSNLCEKWVMKNVGEKARGTSFRHIDLQAAMRQPQNQHEQIIISFHFCGAFSSFHIDFGTSFW